MSSAQPGGRSSTWLAEYFEVSARTIKRDLGALMQSGVPIEPQEGRGGGYRLSRRHSLPPLTFTVGEATALAIALAAEPSLPFGAEGRGALAKVLGAMNAGQRAEAVALSRRVWMRRAGVTRSTASRRLDEAIRGGTVAVLDYRDRNGQRSEQRPVDPMAFARTGGRWYLLAWCRRRDAGRWFRLDRVERVTLTKEPVVHRGIVEVFGHPPADAQPVDLRRVRLRRPAAT